MSVAASSDSAVAVAVAADPNFSGRWRSTAHVNMEAFLIARGFPERNAALASSAVVVQHIRHSRGQLVVQVGDSTTSYSISNGRGQDGVDATPPEIGTEEDLAAALLQNNAEWVDGASAADRRRLVTTTGDIDTSRELSANGTTMTVESTAHTEQGDVVAKTTFERLPDEAADETSTAATAVADASSA